jgi:hypothetical protein
MKLLSIFQGNKNCSRKKLTLLVMIMSTVVAVILHLIWTYQKFESGLGTQVAQIAIMYHFLLLLGMMAMGVGLGHGVHQMIRHKKSIFRNPKNGGWIESFMKLWGYEMKVEEKEAQKKSHQPILDPPMLEPFVLLDLPTRRGRKPAFPLGRWIPIALKWENRDPIRDAFTLGELIAEHLGTNSDGSPIVSEQTYYSVWRQRAIDEIQQRAKIKKTVSVREPEKEHA